MNLVLFFFFTSFLVAGSIVDATICDVVPVDQWDSKPSQHGQDLQKPVQLVVVTHTVTSECQTDSACERIVRAIRGAHIAQGMTDIGLSFLVGGNGKIYEGAGWKVGAHTRGYNDKSISVSFIGDFSNKLPKVEALRTAQNFLSCASSADHLGQQFKLVGHRQLKATISPGDALQNEIQTWAHWTDDTSDL